MLRSTALAAVLLAASAAACRQDGEGKDGAPRTGTPSSGTGDAGKETAVPNTNGAPADDGAWQKTGTGLEYQVLAEGKPGKSPKPGDKVKVNYKGWRLVDGQEKVFDESARNGGPAEFQVGQVIEGWNQALQKMTPGAKWRLRIPPQLGYGARGAGADIPPNSTLYFDVELLAFEAQPELVKIDPAKARTTASGLKYEVVKEGEGASPGPNDRMDIKVTFFGPSGRLLNQQRITAGIADLSLAFLKEAPLMMRRGAHYRFEVPPALAFGAQARGPELPPNSTTYWEIEMFDFRTVQPLAVPTFEPVDEAKMTKRPSGLLFQELKAGAGASPQLGQEVVVHYAGWLPDGTLFDSSYQRGEPATFRVGQVIQGWNEALGLMKPGAVAKIVCPPALAYGESGQGDKIKPGATLVFHVELLSVKP